jgi:hypothetical protein
MKSLRVKISSLFVLAIILPVISVQAQSLRQYQAQIPFDFIIGSKVYKAGDYIIKVEKPLAAGTVLTVQNAKTHTLRQMTVLTNGSRSFLDKTVLMFDRYGDQYILTQMVSTDFGLSAPKTKIKNPFAKNLTQLDETLAIVLTK